jgi:D-alanyl-D-alanine carboxypeptidase
MISNIGDLKTFIQSVYQGRGLSSSMRQQRLTWREMSPHIWYGLGVSKWGGLIGHDGTILGYNSWVGYYPALDVTFIIFVNKCDDNGSSAEWGQRACTIVLHTVFGSAFPFE